MIVCDKCKVHLGHAQPLFSVVISTSDSEADDCCGSFHLCRDCRKPFTAVVRQAIYDYAQKKNPV